MHPRVFLDNFWRNDLRDEVFVAMSFDHRFDAVWENIISPAVEAEPIEGKQLSARRVDISKSGDSILSEITDGIAHAQLVLADISVTDEVELSGKERWFRNGNVMYEVGLAVACRQPVEVVLIRTDERPLLFDVSHIPVIRYSREDATASVKLIRSTIRDRLRERQLVKDLRFKSTIESLAEFEISLIGQNAGSPKLGWRRGSVLPAVAFALPRILDLGILRMVQLGQGDEPNLYEWTVFGRAIANEIVRMGNL